MKPFNRFIKNKRGLAWIYAVFALAVIITPIVWWPLDSCLNAVEDNMNYTLTGSDALAQTVVDAVASYILVFVLITGVYWTVIKAKADAYSQ